MANKRLLKDRVLTNTEKSRRHSDAIAAIDDDMDNAFQEIDWERREAAERDLTSWVRTYCIGLLLDDPPPEKGCQVLSEMQRAVTSHENYMICMGRGSGKSSYVECTALYAIATGIQKYVVIISAGTDQACGLMNDLFRAISEQDSPFAKDYPEVCMPFHIANGSYRRRQMYNGKPTEISKNAKQLILARLVKDDGTEYPTSGSIITVRGVSSGIRGMKKGTMRPSLVLLDDLQTAETAENPMQVEKLMNIIRKDVMCLGGKERLSILQTATPILPDDLVDRIRNDRNWKTTVFPGVISFPVNKDMWKEYFRLYDNENIAGQNHDGSLRYYREHRKEMDEGAEVFNPTRYSRRDGHISAIQKLLEMQHVIGNAAFQAEYQMKPVKYSVALDISPKQVAKKLNGLERLEIPDGTVFVAASTDLNVSFALTTTVVAFKRDMTANVIYHEITPVRIDQKLPEAEYTRAVYDALCGLGRKLGSLSVQINGWGLDASGTPFDAVTLFARNSMQVCGIPACAMCGRASHVFNPFIRSRLTDVRNQTVLCGDAQEQLKAGSGRKYVFWDSDLYRSQVQKAFLSEIGAPGSCSLYGNDPEEHTEYSIQVCNEKLQYVKHQQNGKDMYSWKSADPHDYLDSTAQAFAVAASQGISGRNSVTVPAARRTAVRTKKRIRVI